MPIKTHVSGQIGQGAKASESRKEQGENRFRKRLHITLDPEVYQWLKNKTDNASKFIENLVKAISQEIKPVAVVISAKGDIKTPPAGFEPATMWFEAVSSTVSSESKPETKEILFDEIDLNDLILFWTKERKLTTTEKRAKKVCNVLGRVLKGKPINLESLRQGFHATTNKKDYVNGVRVLLDYLKVRKLMDKETVNDILEMPFLTPIGSEVDEAPEVIKPGADEHIAEVAEWIRKKWDEDTLMVYKLMVFSGLRLEHAVRLLESFDPEKLEFRDNMARYPTGKIGTKIKKSHYAFMPAEFAKKLRRLELKLDANSWQNRIDPKRWKITKEEREILPMDKIKESWINAKKIRKWFENFCKKHEVEELYRSFFLGHSIGQMIKHYEQIREHSWDEYRKVVDKFPIPP